MAKLVSRVYGDALFKVAKDSNHFEQIFEESVKIKRLFDDKSLDDLEKIMSSSKMSKQEKEHVLEEMFKESISKELMGTFVLLIEKGHYKDLEDVLDYFISCAKEEKGIGIVLVKTAVELPKGKKDAVKDKLLKTTKYQSLEISFEVDQSLIGGMVIRIGDRVVDSSIKTKLFRLSRDLRQAQI